jgi:hypothetical protein
MRAEAETGGAAGPSSSTSCAMSVAETNRTTCRKLSGVQEVSGEVMG